MKHLNLGAIAGRLEAFGALPEMWSMPWLEGAADAADRLV